MYGGCYGPAGAGEAMGRLTVGVVLTMDHEQVIEFDLGEFDSEYVCTECGDLLSGSL